MNFGIRIVEKSSNRRGDLFAHLMSDLFVSLGYDEIRLNVAQAGREIDLKGRHRFEERRVVVECKATKEPAGGDVVNKFVGALDAERRRYSGDTIGYLVCLGGFRQTAIEQEEELGTRRVILMDAEKVASELVRGRILVSSDMGVAIARVRASKIDDNLTQVMPLDLLATRFGWAWLVRFGYGGLCTHYVLIHADGSPMQSRTALDVLEDDDALRRDLGTALYLEEKRDTRADIDATREIYLRYLSEQCGEIQLAGLPADEDVGTRRLRLEKLFVPLHLDPFVHVGSDTKERRLSLGKVLKKQTRIAILGGPGVGKSTLIKRIAVAYSDPSRRIEVADDLPERRWFPLLIRCRQLGTAARLPIEEILLTIPERAEMRMEKSAFNMLAQGALQDGSALLLIDGLDEIVEDGDRVAFVDQLRTFLARYTSVALILTSREVGFRIVAGSLATTCRHFTVANLDAADVRRLTIAWHMEVVGAQREVREDAEKLATAITQSNRVMRLAENPLLLTTLLLVRRWVGQLPTRRSVLYAKAVEVLLMTWNVEAHKPLDTDEILPQLAYVAYSMLDHGQQRISQRRLLDVLMAARNDMPEVLAYARMSARDVVRNVEYRSSILVHAGFTVEDGALMPLYEFRHLTFQEYLAARAVVDGHYSNRAPEDSLVDILQRRIDDPSWSEVIPLAAVMAGRRADALIEHLTVNHNWRLLVHCLGDEVQASPDAAAKSLRALAAQSLESDDLRRLRESKYGTAFRELLFEQLLEDYVELNQTAANLLEMEVQGTGQEPGGNMEGIIDHLMASSSDRERISGALLLQHVLRSGYRRDLGNLRMRVRELKTMMTEPSLGAQYVSARTMSLLAESGLIDADASADVLTVAVPLLRKTDVPDLVSAACHVVARLPVIDRRLGGVIVSRATDDLVMPEGVESVYDDARLVLGYYLDRLTIPHIQRQLRSRMTWASPGEWWPEHFYNTIAATLTKPKS